MIRYSDEILEDVRQSNDIVNIISQYVALKRKGRNYFGLCPFHNEKSPSFSVSPDRQIFHCFGCNAGGNVYSFLMKIEGIGFKEAVEQLAEKANISRSFISTIEAPNMVKNFSINILFDLADALEVEASDLLKAANFEDILNKN